jgi:exonuclease III
MVERDEDRSSNTPKKLSNEEQEAWDRLTLKLGLEDAWSSDDFTHHHSLHFSWSNKQAGPAHRQARLDRYYIGKWGRERRGKIEILDGRSTLSDHSPVTLFLRRRCIMADSDRIF